MPRALVGIVGPPGSGKTHVARYLHGRLTTGTGPDAARIVAMDGFHLPNAELDRLGRRERKGAPGTFDAVAFVALVERLRAGDGVVVAPAFARELDEPIADAVVVEPEVPIVLVEGNYLLLASEPWAGLRRLLDLVVYVDTPAEVRTRRLLRRHRRTSGSTEAAEAWIESVDGPNAALVETTRPHADHVVIGLTVPGSSVW